MATIQTGSHEPWVERWTKILIGPLILGLAAWAVQCGVSKATLDRDYVRIAVSILSKKDVDQDLKKWAGDVLAAKSPVPFGPALRKKLEQSPTILPPVHLGYGEGRYGAEVYGGGIKLLRQPDGSTILELPEGTINLSQPPRLQDLQSLPKLFPSTTTLPPTRPRVP